MANENIITGSQRNLNDVATELTLKYMEDHSLGYEQFAKVYKVFFKNALECSKGEFDKK